MEFRIADTFTDSLARLTGDEQKAVKTAAFDLQLNPAHPSLQFHKLEKPRDKRFWSIRVSSDIRLIVHRSEASLLLCYVAHHDDAYLWAEKRKLETHPKTGAAQFVEIRETVQEIAIPKYVEIPHPKPLLFDGIPDDVLLGYGIPAEWLKDVRAANEDTVLELAGHLPSEAAEALLELATGATPVPVTAAPAVPANPFEHPDALRRFRVITNIEELEQALNFPWDKWIVFLHPAQRQLVRRNYAGPARVSGSAGTGKTIVALHRAAFLARENPDSRVLLTTFSDALANALQSRLRKLISSEPRLGERLEVHSITEISRRLYELNVGKVRLATREQIRELLNDCARQAPESKFSLHFLETEWAHVVDAWQLDSWEAYRDVARLGRRTRLKEAQRAILWSIFARTQSALAERELTTYAQVFTRLASRLRDGPSGGAGFSLQRGLQPPSAPGLKPRLQAEAGSKNPPFDFVVIDEAQDLTVAQLRFLSALGAKRPNGLFFAGDLGQRIFQQPFSWKALGVDIRGRASTLRINYRTSHQIRARADRLLGPELSDVDGNKEQRTGTVSTFNGPEPEIMIVESAEDEIEAVSKWLAVRCGEGVLPHEIGIFVRSEAQLDRARAAVERARIPYKILDHNVETTTGKASISTMHLAKGLEFRTVVVMACDDEVIPLQSRIEAVADDSDLEEVYNTERHLLYVACTRARDHLLVTGVQPASEFLDDLQSKAASEASTTP